MVTPFVLGVTFIKVNGMLTMISIFILAMQLPEIIRKWGEINGAMNCYATVPKSVILKLKSITIFLMLMALGNIFQLFYVYYNKEAFPAEQLLLMTVVATKSDTFEISDFVRSYVEQLQNPFFKIIQYNTLTGIIFIVGFKRNYNSFNTIR